MLGAPRAQIMASWLTAAHPLFRKHLPTLKKHSPSKGATVYTQIPHTCVLLEYLNAARFEIAENLTDVSKEG